MNSQKQDLKLLMVEDQETDCHRFLDVLKDSERYHISQWKRVINLEQTLEFLKETKSDNEKFLIILDIELGKGAEEAGIEILKEIRAKKNYASYPIIVWTRYWERGFQEEMLRLGVDGFLSKDHDRKKERLPSVECVIEKSIKVSELRKKYFETDYGIKKKPARSDSEDSVDLFGISDPMRQVFHQVFRTAANDSCPNVLILGETGTGKSAVARAIWALGPRSNGPFKELVVNTIAPDLLTSELFGHKKGAFTGASSDKRGLIEACQNGTLFLDEIGELPLKVQVMLLQALREKRIRRLGSEDFIKVDFQLISATNRNLEGLVKFQKFRADLYHRIRGVQIRVPLLKDRFQECGEELDKIIEQEQKDKTFKFIFIDKAKELLKNHPWPGNYAELKTLIMDLSSLCTTVVDEDMVAQRLLKPEYFLKELSIAGVEAILDNSNYDNALKQLKDIYLEHWITKCGGNITKTAKTIDVDPATIHRWKQGRSGESNSEEGNTAPK